MTRARRLTTGSAAVVLVLALPVTASAAPAVFGGHLGTNDDPIVLTTDAAFKKLTGTVIAFDNPCDDGKTQVFHESVPVVAAKPGLLTLGRWVMTKNAKGSFTGTFQRNLNLDGGRGLVLTMKLHGTLGRTGGSGTLSAHSTITDVPAITPTLPTSINLLQTCDTGTLKWKVVHRPGVVYGGRTSSGEAFVLTLSASRRSVKQVDVGWHAACVPDGFFDYPDTLINFSLTGGRFGGSFRWTPEGTTTNVDYVMRGKVSRASSSGSLAVKVTFADGTSCDTGNTSWTARSS
ncbi:MAG TPA: hypothetical protein PKB03_05380 [Baekduia sp.]|nr:hypothetical protein [Baekduia sp.]